MYRSILLLALLVVAPQGWSAENSLPCWARLFFVNRNAPILTAEPVNVQVESLAKNLKKKF